MFMIINISLSLKLPSTIRIISLVSPPDSENLFSHSKPSANEKCLSRNNFYRIMSPPLNLNVQNIRSQLHHTLLHNSFHKITHSSALTICIKSHNNHIIITVQLNIIAVNKSIIRLCQHIICTIPSLLDSFLLFFIFTFLFNDSIIHSATHSICQLL